MITSRLSSYALGEIDNIFSSYPIFLFNNFSTSARTSICNAAIGAIHKNYDIEDEILTDLTITNNTITYPTTSDSQILYRYGQGDIKTERDSLFSYNEIDSLIGDKISSEFGVNARMFIFNIAMQAVANIWNKYKNDTYKLSTLGLDNTTRKVFNKFCACYIWPSLTIKNTGVSFFTKTSFCTLYIWPTLKIILRPYVFNSTTYIYPRLTVLTGNNKYSTCYIYPRLSLT